MIRGCSDKSSNVNSSWMSLTKSASISKLASARPTASASSMPGFRESLSSVMGIIRCVMVLIYSISDALTPLCLWYLIFVKVNFYHWIQSLLEMRKDIEQIVYKFRN